MTLGHGISGCVFLVLSLTREAASPTISRTLNIAYLVQFALGKLLISEPLRKPGGLECRNEHVEKIGTILPRR